MMRKIAMGAVALAFIAAPLFASADTLSDLQAQVQQLLAQIASMQAQLNISTAGAAATNTTSSSAAAPALIGNLYAGESDATTNGGVTILQQFLGISPTTGYFGSATLQAVENWQSSHGLVSSGSASTTGFGFVGPRTRAAMGFGSSASGNTGSGTAGSPQSASFSATPKSGAAPLSVYFRYNNPTSGGSYLVSFGDGTSGTLTYQVPPCASSAAANCPSYYVASHSYTSVGTYTATLSPQYSCPMNADGTVGICNTPNEQILGTVTITVTSTGTGIACPGGATATAGVCPPIPTPNPTPAPVTTTATFTASPTSGAAPLTVTFTSNTLGMVSFGDGTSGMLIANAIPMYLCALGVNSNCVNPTPTYSTSHTYTSANAYSAVLTKGNCACPLSGTCNCPNQAVLGTVTITVTGGSTQGATFTASPTTGAAPLAVQFKSTGAQGTNIGATVNFGDGTTGTLLFAPVCSQCNALGTVGHTYAAAGTYPATLLDSSGNVLGSATITVSGLSTQPMSFSAYPTSGAAPLQVSFTGPQGAVGETINFGDGTSGTMTTVIATCVAGTANTSCGPRAAASHTYTTTGTFTATLTSGNCPCPSSGVCNCPMITTATGVSGSVTITVSGGNVMCPAIARVCPAGQVDQVSASCVHTCVTSTPSTTICNGANNSVGGCSSTPTPVTPGSGSAPGTSSGSSQSSTNAGILSQVATALTAIEAILKALGVQ